MYISIGNKVFEGGRRGHDAASRKVSRGAAALESKRYEGFLAVRPTKDPPREKLFHHVENGSIADASAPKRLCGLAYSKVAPALQGPPT